MNICIYLRYRFNPLTIKQLNIFVILTMVR